MENSFSDPVWFLWPVTFAFLAGIAVYRLLRRGAARSAALVVAALALPVLPLTFALPVYCGDDDAGLDLRPIPLAVGLLAIVAWLAIVFRLRIRAGDDREAADRSVLWSAAALVPLGFIELAASVLTRVAYCREGQNTSRIAHLLVAGGVLAVAALAGAVRRSR